MLLFLIHILIFLSKWGKHSIISSNLWTPFVIFFSGVIRLVELWLF